MMDSKGQQEYDEERKCLSIFPLEIWMVIFEHIRSPHVQGLCSEAGSFLKQLVEPFKNIYLLPKVLGILDEQFDLEPKETFDCKATVNGLLRCRLVCQGWKSAVDHFLETRHSRQAARASKLYCQAKYKGLVPSATFSIRGPVLKLNACQINTVEHHIFADDHQTYNNFPGRFIIIDDYPRVPHDILLNRSNNAAERLRVATETFLKKCGFQFWYAQLEIGCHMTVSEWYKLLIRFVQLMPNLKSLYITKGTWTHANQNDLSEMSQLPFPRSPSLEVIMMKRTPAITSILAANHHAKTVEIFYFCDPYTLPYETIDWDHIECSENTTSFSISISSPAEYTGMPATWKLHTLRLVFDGFQTFWEWPIIFKKLESYKDTLTDLSMVFSPLSNRSHRVDTWSSSAMRLNLPKLKNFRMPILGCISGEFLLGLKSLEHMCLHFIQDCGADFCGHDKCEVNDDKVIFHDFTSFQSQIWKMMPTLQTVTHGATGNGKCYKRPGSRTNQ